MNSRTLQAIVMACTATVALVVPAFAAVTLDENADFTLAPPTIAESVDPNVLLNMSVEIPMGGAAYNDQSFDDDGNGSIESDECSGRPTGNTGDCYFPERTYLGYFNPNLCYTYTTSNGGYFQPSSTVLNSNHECTGKWSGNALNWATMTAIDMYAFTMTGGNRVIDTTTWTVVRRLRAYTGNTNWFPYKRLNNGTNVHPRTVTPFNNGNVYLTRTDYGFEIGTSTGSSSLGNGTYNVRVHVCDGTIDVDRPGYCKAYQNGATTYYKPEGLIQENAHRMRFGVIAYANDNDRDRHGGVLRAPMKYVGPQLPDGSANPFKEFGDDGLFDINPHNVTGAIGSGVIQYVNRFDTNGLKVFDPVSELFYEAINYYKNRGPTQTYTNGLGALSGGFPVITNWNDPIEYACQKNYMVAINDAFPHVDKRLPGTSFTSSTYHGVNLIGSDFGEPSNPDPDINVTDLTKVVGDLEGITNTSRCVGCAGPGACDMNGTNKLITNLGLTFGTCPGPARQNSFYVAGLAYYANTQDLRDDVAEPDMPGMQNVTTFMIDSQEFNNNPPIGSMNMLYLTGKYGGFNDLDGDGTPANTDGTNIEWDSDGDGQPDNYVLANQPEKMVDALTRVISQIAERSSSGTSTAVVSNSRQGVGATYQSYYEPVRTDANGNEVSWIGTVHGLFIDDQGYLREDTDGDAILDGYDVDAVVQIFFDASGDNRTEKRSILSNVAATIDLDDPTTITVGADEPLTELDTIWNAREWLSNPAMAANINRTYTTVDNTKRYIFTWIDADNDNVVDSTGVGNGEVFTFESSNISSSNFGHFNVATRAEAQSLVNYVRGEEQTGKRNRTINYDGTGSRVMRLGDVVHSSPTLVATPNESFDLLYDDTTYTAFRAQYVNRRHVIYSGANDGMLHAFNGGFYDAAAKQFRTTIVSQSAHALGAELWAYAPMNLLPHLKWLQDPEYAHVYYVDGSIKAFDAKIFTADADHPNGWGTVLAVGMRFGGSPMTVDVDLNGVGTGSDKEFASAYILLDVTNPEKPPRLIAELNDPAQNFASGMGFSLGEPAVFTIKSKADANINNWFMVFGAGPNDLGTATRAGDAQFYVYDLVNGAFLSDFDPMVIATPEANSFVGGISSVDWDLDYAADSVYFGTAGNDSSTGKLYKINLMEEADPDDWEVHQFLDAGAPIVEKPTLGLDALGNHWVFTGTGRFYVNGDKTTSDQQSMFGIKDPETYTNTPIINDPANQLLDVTAARVFADGSVTNLSGFTNFAAIQGEILGNRLGWKRALDNPSTDPSERASGSSRLLGGVLFSSSFQPDSAVCEAEGDSSLFGLHFQTGTAFPVAIFDEDPNITNNSSNLSLAKLDTGAGLVASPSLHIGSGGNDPNRTTITAQKSDGSLVQDNARTVFAIGSGEISWRELVDPR